MAAESEVSNGMAYYSSSQNDLLFEADGPNQMTHCFHNWDLSSQEDDGVQLQISHQLYNKKFRKVVSVIVTVEKLKNMLVPDSLTFQDDDLRDIFSYIFEEEPINCEIWDDKYVCDAPPRWLNCRLQDIEQKCLVLSDTCQLHALHLRGESLDQQVIFCMSYVQGEETDDDKIPVALGLKNKNLYLSCEMEEGKPTLQLTRVDPNSFPKKKMESKFVFNKRAVKEHFEFESAKYPNWYISTSQAEQMPVFLVNTRGNQDITDFFMEVISP